MIPQISSPGSDTAEDLQSYIMMIYQSCVESSANVESYLLSSSMVSAGTTFNAIFRVFYRDFYRLVVITRCLPTLNQKGEMKTAAAAWFEQSELVLDGKNKDKRRSHAKAGLKLCMLWIEMLYDKQIIRNVRS